MQEKKTSIERITNMKDLKETENEKEANIREKKIFGKIKRKYRLLIIFIVFLSLIVGFMILPMIIAVYLNL